MNQKTHHYLALDFPIRSIAAWAWGKFGIELTPEALGGAGAPHQNVKGVILARVADLYRRREIEYPVEYALDMTVAQGGTDNAYALTALVDWANHAGASLGQFI